MTENNTIRIEDPTPSLLEPDTIVPAQYFDRVGTDIGNQPEKRLMLAILEDAVTTFQRHVHSETRRSKRLVEDVEAWTAGAESEDSFSFEGVCAALDIEPAYIRRGLARWKAAELRRVHQGGPSLYRPPVRRVNGRRHRITGPREYYKKSA
jgi:hypothetical protein